MSFTGRLPQIVMAKALLLMTIFATMTVAAQNNVAVQSLILNVFNINKAGLSHLPLDHLPDRGKSGSPKGKLAGAVPLAATSLNWVSTSDEKKISLEATGNTMVVILGGSSTKNVEGVALRNTKAAGATLTTIGKSGSIDLEICIDPAAERASSEEDISKIVYTFTNS